MSLGIITLTHSPTFGRVTWMEDLIQNLILLDDQNDEVVDVQLDFTGKVRHHDL